MKAWFRQLQRREQWALLIAAGVLGSFLFWRLLWQPLADNSQRLNARINAQQHTLISLQQLAQEAEQLRTSPRRDAAEQRGSLLGLADRTARAQRLAGALKRIEPDGDDRIRVYLEQASFDHLMNWLQEVAVVHRVLLTQINADAGEQPGLVNAQVTLQNAP